MDPVSLAFKLVAVLQAYLRLTDTARPAWSWIPTKLQPVFTASVFVAPDIVAMIQAGEVKSWLDLANVALFAVVAFGNAMRGALPAKHYEELPKLAKVALKDVRSGKSRRDDWSSPSSAAVILFAIGLGVANQSCTATQAAAVTEAVSDIAAEALFRAAQTSEVIDMVEAKIDALPPELVAKLPPELVAKIRTAIAAARATNAAAIAAVRAGEKTAQVANEAFAPVRDAWGQLLALLAEAGLAQSGALKASPGEVAIPAPLALEPF